MKKIILVAMAFVMIAACDNPVSNKIKETKEQVSNTSKAVKEMNKIQDDIKELQAETPLTNEELKAWLPDEINGMKRIAYKAGHMGMMQISSLEATYATENKDQKFKIEIIDGAGELGATATAAFRMMFSQDFEEEDEYKTRRTVKKNGNKAIEEFRKDRNNSQIEFMQDERFYIKAYGTNMNIEETWDAIGKLDAEDLI